MKVSVIIPCKNRLDQLKQCLPTVLNQTYQDVEIIVVDYNSPDGLGNYISSVSTKKRLIRLLADVPADYWNLSKSRNLGYTQSDGQLLLFLDADTILDPRFLEIEVPKLTFDNFLTGLTESPWNGCGCMLVKMADFEMSGGYNELMEGWGYDDFDMYARLKEMGLRHEFFNPELIANLPHPDSGRNEFHANEDKYLSKERNYNIHLSGEFKSSI